MNLPARRFSTLFLRRNDLDALAGPQQVPRAHVVEDAEGAVVELAEHHPAAGTDNMASGQDAGRGLAPGQKMPY